MTTFQDLQAEHEALLNRHEAPADPAQFWADVQHFIDRIRIEAEHIPTPRERDQLRAILRFWASYVYDKTGSYPDTTLRPAMNAESSKAASIESSVPPPEAPIPTPTPPPHRSPVVWGIAALACVAIFIAVMALVAPRNASPATNPTAEPALPDYVATQVYVQMQVNAAMTEVVAASSTPTPAPTSTATPSHTPRPTRTLLPTDTPTPTNMPTSTPVVVLPGTRVPEVIPPLQPDTLSVGFQILTQGPSPFDAEVWVIQLKVVGIGGNGSYIYWADGQQLPDAEYTVQGKSCEPQALTLGVTSAGQAVKRDIVLNSPLIACLTEKPR
jgi:hypothetical protein